MDDNGNANKVLRFFSEDGKYSADLSLYNQRVSFSVFENGAKNPPVVKMMFTQFSGDQISNIMNKVLSDKDIKAPIEQGCHPFVKESNAKVFKSAMAVGRDKEGAIFFDFSSDIHKDPIRFYPIGDRSIFINGMELPKVTHTENGVRTTIRLMKILLEASIYAKDNPQTFTPGASSPATGGGFSNEFSAPPIGDDINF